MSLFLTVAFLFSAGSLIGWCLEVVFRRFFSSQNPERRWINPGFCRGPYLPLYGSGLSLMYLIASQERYLQGIPPAAARLLLFFGMAVCMTGIEYVSGIYLLRVNKVRLWDYTGQWGNIQGVICPKFSLIWAALGAIYYFLIHPCILDALAWLARNLAFSFVIGMFYGVFSVDVCISARVAGRLKAFAEENRVIVRYEVLKEAIRKSIEERRQRYHFFSPFQTDRALHEHLEELRERFEKLGEKKGRKA